MQKRLCWVIGLAILTMVARPERCEAASCNAGDRIPPHSGAVRLPNDFGLRVPFKGTHRITNGYGSGYHQHTSDPTHANDYHALDFDLNNDAVLAMQGGKVIYAGWATGGWSTYGKIVIVDHQNGFQSLYAHLSSIGVSVGHNVSKGAQIAVSGATGVGGAHLHIAVYKNANVQRPGGPYGGRATVPEPMSGYYSLTPGSSIHHGGCGGGCSHSPGEGAPNSSIKNKFKAAYNRGNDASKLGCPRGKVKKCSHNSGVTGKQGWYQSCADGSIMYRKGDAKAFAVYGRSGGFYSTWDSLNYQYGPLGFPRSHKYSTTKSRYDSKGAVQCFEGGRIYNTSKLGRHAVYGEVFDQYKRVNGLKGYLGFPVSHNNVGSSNAGQSFEGGYIKLDGGRDAHPRFARQQGTATVWEIVGGVNRRSFVKSYQFEQFARKPWLRDTVGMGGHPWDYVVEITAGWMGSYENRGEFELLLRGQNDKTYFIDGGKKHLLGSMTVLEKRGFDPDLICRDNALLNSLPAGPKLTADLSDAVTLLEYPSVIERGSNAQVKWRMDGIAHRTPTRIVWRVDGGERQGTKYEYQCGVHSANLPLSNVTGDEVEILAWAKIGGETLVRTSWHQIQVGDGGGCSVTITDGPSGDVNPCASAAQVQCSVSAEDNSGHGLIYSWTAEDSGGNAAGSFDDATKQNPIWTAPDNDTALVAEYEISVTVTCAQEQGVNASGSYTQQVASVLYSISGTVLDSDGNELEGVIVSAGGKSVTTAADGSYTIEGLVAGTYTVAPSDAKWAFEPASRAITVNATTDNATGVDFTGFASTSVLVSLARGWNMIALGQANDSTVTFGELLGSSVLAIYAWDGGQQEYVQIPLTDPISVLPSGYGIWVLMLEAKTVSIPIKIPPDPNPNPVNLYRGWNLLGNPFPVEIYLGPNLKPTSGDDTLNNGYAWLNPPGEYAQVTCVTTCQGVWVLAAVAEQAEPLAAEFNLQPAPPPAQTSVAVIPLRTRPDVPESSTCIQLAARSGDALDAGNWFGVTTASLGWKRPKPPTAPGSVSVYLDTEDYGVGYGTSLVPSNERSHVWTATVVAAAGQEIELYLPDTSRLPGDMAVWLEDLTTGTKTDLRHAQCYTYKPRTGQRQFKLWLGKRTGSVQITGVTTQTTRVGAQIAYTLSADADVAIEIRNIAGRLIRAIPCGTAAAGLNTATWNLRNATGAPVPSGTYLCTVAAKAADGSQLTAIRTMTVRR